MKKLFIIIIFLFLATGVLGLVYWVRNPFSQADLKVEITAEREVALFERVNYRVRYRNNGNVRLDGAVLTFEFPELTIPDDDLSLRNQIELGSIYPGEERTVTFSGRLVGEENETKEAEVNIRYQPRNLTAFYESSTSFSTVIGSIPISFDMELPSNLSTERPFSFSVDYFSRLDFPLSDLKVKIEYPEKFTFLESTPRGKEETEWDIPLLNRAEGGRIQIQGKIEGETSDQKFFTASLGIWQRGTFVILKEITKGTKISDPDLYVFQRINGKDEYVAKPGELLHYEIFFRNIGDESFSRLSLINRLKGDLFDEDSIKVMDGRQSDLDLMWDWREVSKLNFLDKGQEGMVEFWVEVKDEEKTLKRNALDNIVTISGMREEFSLKVSSKVDFAQKAFYQDEVFGNRGPIPPQAGEVTTYTVNWQIKNFYNDLKDVAIKANLPSNVRLTGEFFPSNKEDQITFDSQSREIIWRAGNLKAGEDFDSVSFQVALEPSMNQIGQVLPIIGEATAKGIDIWTEKEIEINDSKIDTNLPHDPFSGGKGEVQ